MGIYVCGECKGGGTRRLKGEKGDEGGIPKETGVYSQIR